MRFANKVVIVTGASLGIGATTALQFAKEGADVVIVSRTEEKLKKVAEQIAKIGKAPLVVPADVGKQEDAKRIISKTIEKYGKIDVLVNNAGFGKRAVVDEEEIVNVYDAIFSTNVRSVVLLTSLAAPYLKKTKGNIINISSVAGKRAFSPGGASYAASKAALDQYSRNSALELAQFGVRVNIISPGPVKTNFFESAGVANPDYNAIAQQLTALKILTQPEEVSEVILFLASDKARSITGADYVIDAGALVKGSS